MLYFFTTEQILYYRLWPKTLDKNKYFYLRSLVVAAKPGIVSSVYVCLSVCLSLCINKLKTGSVLATCLVVWTTVDVVACIVVGVWV